MKEVYCAKERFMDIEDGQIGQAGNGIPAYRIENDWAKWPECLDGTHVLTGEFDTEGRLYAATDDKNNPITVFASDGTYLESVGAGLFVKAHSAYMTPNNTILVADSSKNAHVIREITKEGELVRDFGIYGQASDTGYDSNYIETLRAEGRKPTTTKYNANEASNARLDSIRRLGKPFCRPCAVTMNEAGEYFAADGYGNAAVHKFDAKGTHLKSWGGPGCTPGNFRLVHDIQLDCRGRIWVADRENCRVQVFDQQGELLALITGNLMRIGGVWTDHSYAYIGELDGGITIVNLDFCPILQIGYYGSPLHAHGITGDDRGNLYLFTNKRNKNNIIKLTKLKC